MKKTTIRALLAGFSILLLVTLAYFSRSGLEGEAFAGVLTRECGDESLRSFGARHFES